MTIESASGLPRALRALSMTRRGCVVVRDRTLGRMRNGKEIDTQDYHGGRILRMIIH